MKMLVISTAAIFALTACLGGSESELPDYYVGKTDPAPMDATNAKDIIKDINDTSAYQYSFLGSFGIGRSKLEKQNILEDMKRGISPRRALSDGYISLGIKETGGSADGPCGGKITVAKSSSGAGGKYTIKLNDYCEISGDSEITTNGSLVMDMSDSDDDDKVKFTRDTTSTDGVDTVTQAGSMIWSISLSNTVLFTLNMTTHDSKTGESVKIENYIYEDNLVIPLVVSASGRVYLSRLDGYFDIATPVKFTGESLYTGFSAGEMVFSAGSSTVTVTVQDDGDCSFVVDEDGDDVAELTETGECSGYLF